MYNHCMEDMTDIPNTDVTDEDRKEMNRCKHQVRVYTTKLKTSQGGDPIKCHHNIIKVSQTESDFIFYILNEDWRDSQRKKGRLMICLRRITLTAVCLRCP